MNSKKYFNILKECIDSRRLGFVDGGPTGDKKIGSMNSWLK